MRMGVTNGCFDLLHPGHVKYLQEASRFCDYLTVVINSDAAVHRLKGEGRPIIAQNGRVSMLKALRCVDSVLVADDTCLAGFFDACFGRIDVYIKGGDYSLETLDPDERRVLESYGAEFRFIPLSRGYSTTEIIMRARASLERKS